MATSEMTDVESDESAPDLGVVVVLPEQPFIQSRFSVAARPLLVMPFAVVALVFVMVASVMSVGGWFGALATGRVPDAVQDLQQRFLSYFAKFLAYAHLLTNALPGMDVGPSQPNSIDVEIAHVSQDRWSVLFRAVLAIPAVLLQMALAVGTGAIWIVVWLWTVIRGSVPDVAHQTFATVVRYQVRAAAYVFLATPAHPYDGLLADGLVRTGSTEDSLSDNATNTASFPAVRSRTLVLGVMVLGTVLVLVTSVWATLTVAQESRSASLGNSVMNSYVETSKTVTRFARTATTCSSSQCVRDAATLAAHTIYRQIDAIERDHSFPASANADYGKFISGLSLIAQELVTIPTSANLVEQQRLLTLRVFNPLVNELIQLGHEAAVLRFDVGA